MCSNSWRRLVGWAVLVLVAACGCAQRDELNRQDVSGQVTFRGQPLDQGHIQFEPAGNPDGIFTGTEIHEGHYALEDTDGLPAGSYRVRIFSSEPGPATDPGPPGEAIEPPPPERIPSQFNTESTVMLEVRAGQQNTFDVTIP